MSTPFHSSALHEGFIFGVVEESLLGNLERIRKHSDGGFARKVFPTLDIRDLIHGQLTPFRQFLLTQV